MNYLRIYNGLIEHATLRTDIYGYFENHHIIPKCMGGKNFKSNIVKLTFREHYIAHKLLYKHYRTTKLAHAWFSMVRASDNQVRNVTSKMYSEAKDAHRREMSIAMSGEGNHFYGKKHSEKSKQLLRDFFTGKTHSNETRKKMSDSRLGVKKSPEHKRKIGRKGLIMLQNIKTLEIIRIPKVDVGLYDLTMWVNPKKITPELKYKCKYCDMVTTKGMLARWHDGKCKQRIDI